MDIYKYLKYKEFIKDWVEVKKELNLKITYQKLAQEIGVQKTYLSKVLNSDAHLNSDQLYKLSKSMTLNKEEGEYLLLLLDLARTSLKEREEILLKKIQRIQASKLETTQYIKKSTLSDESKSHLYFLNPWTQIIHIGLTIPVFQKKPQELMEALGLSDNEFQRILKTLEDQGIIEVSKNIKILQDSVHLMRSSPYFWSWYNQITTLSREHFRKLNDKDDLNFAVTFSANEEARLKLKKLLLQFLEEAQDIVEDSPSESLYQINIDLGSWRL